MNDLGHPATRTFADRLEALVENILRDVQYGLRTLRRGPGFTITALLTLALTTGAVSTVLSLANAMLLRPVAASRPEELVVVEAIRRQPSVVRHMRVSFVDYTHVRDRSKTLQGLAALAAGGAPRWLSYNGKGGMRGWAVVSANFLPVLGLKPALGRFFTADEDRVPDRDRVAVLSHHLWQEGWGEAPEALGAIVKLDGVPFTVIGVAPRGFHGPDPQRSEIYIPTMMLREIGISCDAIADPDCGGTLQMVGRLRDGRTLEEVAAEVPMLAPARWKERAANESGPTELTAVRPRGAWGMYGGIGLLEWEEGTRLFLIAGVCLLLGCANLGGLLLARGSSRARELAIRASVGAAPSRLVGQLMTESLLLAAGGGALGLVLSTGLVRLYSELFYERAAERLYHYNVSLDALVIGSAAAVSVATAFLFGLLPAVDSARLGFAPTLSRRVASASAAPRLARGLIAGQLAVALALVTLAALFSSSERRFVTDGRFDPAPVALLRVAPSFSRVSRLRYPPDKAQELHRAAVQRMQGLPGVAAVGLWDGGGALDGRGVKISRSPGPAPGVAEVRGSWKAISPGYFSALGTPLLRGRDFDARDSLRSPPAAIVNQSLALRFWPAQDPIGSSLVVDNGPPAEVVGVVADVYAPSPGAPASPQVYVNFWQQRRVDARYCVRLQGDPASALPMLVRAVNQLDADVPVKEAMPMTAALADAELKPVRLAGAVAAYAAMLAVLLSLIGVYGTLAFSVARRTREVGVRIALGAAPRDVIAMILREEMRVIAAGVAAGLAMAWGASRLAGHLLFGIASGNGLIYLGATLVVTAAALVACWIPARRAACLEPRVALNVD